MIFATGVGLLIFLACVYGACFRLSGVPWPRTAREWLIGVIGALLLVLLLFRPEEEVEAGEDAAAYFHAAISYASHGSLRFPDSGLMAVPAEERPLFRYGHAGFLFTKDAVLWAKDETMAEVGPHFFPGYSILLAVPIALGLPYAAFWISPILAIMIGSLLALLARWLTGRVLLGGLAFALYILNPVVIWNARCFRAEWPASFLAIAGITLTLGHVVMGRNVSRAGAFMAGLALASASLFHITAVYVLLPAIAWALWHTRWTRFWSGWWMGIAVGVFLFAMQLVRVTDPYWILDNLVKPGMGNKVLVGLLLIAGVMRLARRLVDEGARRLPVLRAYSGYVLAVLISAVFVGLAIYGFRVNPDQGLLPGFPSWSASYISLTAFEGVQRMISRLALLVGLVGLPLLGLRSGAPGRLGTSLLFMLAPASATIGWVYSFLFETRRMATFLVPLLVLATILVIHVMAKGMTATIQRIKPLRPEWGRRIECWAPVLLALALIFVGIRGRTHLYTSWNHQGAFAFYKTLADNLKERGDFLFAEYTQTAVPIERLADLPLLPIAWGYRAENEYRAAEQVILRLAEESPERRYLLVTPFAGSALPGLLLEPVDQTTLNSKRIGRARRMVPAGPHPYRRTMHAYRIHLAGQPDWSQPYHRVMDGGLLGLAGTANRMPNRSISMDGLLIGPDVPFVVPALLLSKSGGDHLRWVFYCPEGASKTRIVLQHQDGDEIETSRIELGNLWLALELARAAIEPGELVLSSTATLYLTDAFAVSHEGTVLRIPLTNDLTTGFTVSAVDSHWFRAASSIAIPRIPGASRWLWIMATRGREDDAYAQVSITRRGDARAEHIWRVQSGWSWQLIPLADIERASTYWHDLAVEPAWNPGLSNFPADLGLCIHRVMVE